MYFLYDLERTITLHPSFFGPRVKEYLTNRLLEDVEGTCTGSYYIICVMDAYDISEGRVVPGSAVAEYTVHYRAVVWRPFKGETVCRASRQSHDMHALRSASPLRSMPSSARSTEWECSLMSDLFLSSSPVTCVVIFERRSLILNFE